MFNIPAVGDEVQTYAQGILGSARNSSNQQVWGSFNAPYEFTFVASFREVISSVGGDWNDPSASAASSSVRSTAASTTSASTLTAPALPIRWRAPATPTAS